MPLGGLVAGSAEDKAEAGRAGGRALDRLSKIQDGRSPGAGEHVRRAEARARPDARVGYAGGALDDETTQAIEARRGGGRRLERDVLRRMSTAFGTDLSDVRIHDDAGAAELSRRLSAHAFTTGSDVFFGKGVYAPRTPAGERVLAHELAHTLQPDQAAGPARRRVRRLPWKEPLPSTTIDIYVSPTELMSASVYELANGGHHTTKAEAAWALVDRLAQETLPLQTKFPAAGVLTSLLNGKVLSPANFADVASDDKGTKKQKKTKQNLYKNMTDPFTVKGSATYGDARTVLEIYWQFSKASYGYVTTIVQGTQRFTMHPERGNAEVAATLADEKDPLRKKQWEKLIAGDLTAAELTSFYGSAHDISHSDELIEGHANRDLVGISGVGLAATGQAERDPLVTQARTNLRQDHQTLDGLAKIAGEGARFQCVRALKGRLKDNSRFYVSTGGQTHSVTLQTLWGVWGGLFDAAWNIPDDKVKNTMLAGLFKTAMVTTPDADFNPTPHDHNLAP